MRSTMFLHSIKGSRLGEVKSHEAKHGHPAYWSRDLHLQSGESWVTLTLFADEREPLDTLDSREEA